MGRKVEVIEIDSKKRYIFLIYGNLDAEALEDIAEQLCEWWDSNSKCIIIGVDKDLKVRIESVDE